MGPPKPVFALQEHNPSSPASPVLVSFSLPLRSSSLRGRRFHPLWHYVTPKSLWVKFHLSILIKYVEIRSEVPLSPIRITSRIPVLMQLLHCARHPTLIGVAFARIIEQFSLTIILSCRLPPLRVHTTCQAAPILHQVSDLVLARLGHPKAWHVTRRRENNMLSAPVAFCTATCCSYVAVLHLEP